MDKNKKYVKNDTKPAVHSKEETSKAMQGNKSTHKATDKRNAAKSNDKKATATGLK